MPELETQASGVDRPTLTQKRSPQAPPRLAMDGSIPKMGSASRPERLQTTPITPNKVGDEGSKSSPARIVIWVVIVAALAVASYFALRNVLSGPTGGDETVEPTVTIVEEDPLDMFYDDEVLGDDEAADLQTDGAFTDLDQTVGVESDTVFEVTDFLISRYDSFTRISFVPSVISGDTNLPLITSEYISTEEDTTIELNALNTYLSEELELLNGEEFLLGTDSIASVYIESQGGETVVEEEEMVGEEAEGEVVLEEVTEEEENLIAVQKNFSLLITLNAPVRYVLHVSIGDEPRVYVDILEVEQAVTTLTPTTTAAVTSTPLPGASILETTYSTEAQELRDGLTTNTASSGLFTIDPSTGKSFFWSQYSDAFYFYRAINKGDGGTKFPKVTAEYEDDLLIVEVYNLTSRNATMEPTAPVSPYVQTYKVSQSGNVLRMEFQLSSAKPYKLSFKDFRGSQSVLVQIKNV